MSSLPISEIKSIISKYIPDPTVKVFIFGSRAIGTARTWSDIDIGVVHSNPLPSGAIGNIKEELEESTIPYMVDVVDFHWVSDSFKKVALQKTIPL